MNRLLRRLAATLLGCAAISAAAQPADRIELVDLAGRRVELPAKVDRLLLGEGRFLPTLAILERDAPLRRVVGTMGEFERVDPDGYAVWARHHPDLDRLPRIGRTAVGSFSVEQAIALRPQVAIFGLEGHGPAPKDRETIARLQAAGTAIVFIDLRQDPLVNTPRSVTLLGRILGREQEAAAFTRYYESQVRLVTQRLRARRPPSPSVFLESRVGLVDGCCETMVGMLGKLLDAAGGLNIAHGLIPGEHGNLNPEYLIARQPDVYIGTAIGANAPSHKSLRIVLGAAASRETARASLQRAASRRGMAQLHAVQRQQAYAVWHHFYNSPLNVVALQVMAKWLHPDLFHDLDPQATLGEMYRRFQPIPLTGEYWIGLQ
ncbi:ABC transporter substrate-binding protein [Caldimonas brevitalea]|uniref:Iron ABC transporter substrate-binding protein n=1 Tax=Caldimonas brevitalea TaxID=413882 RepID=A0A0G3BQR6_9BURK|nr:ABC transporter substrate-binding protein [Caldimonas brevitalea]AKJ29741.1 iron ABC transporter substrate-binding protein [Caldimonas brevitalea]